MDKEFKELVSKIMLTEKQVEDAQIKYTGVCSTLHDIYYPKIKYSGTTKLLIGSYAKSTNIRPPRDVDVIFKMPETEFKRFDELKGNKQSQLLQEIRAVIKDTYTTTETIKAFGKVVTIEFADGTHNVELLPAWELGDSKYRIPNSENGGSWEIYDPVKEINNVSTSNVNTGKTLNLIRILKKWSEYCSAPLKSFIIELLVIEYLNGLSKESIEKPYSELVSILFSFIIGKANQYVISPDNKIIALGDGWKSRAETAYQRSQKAIEYEKKGKGIEASDEWKKIFGDDFPKGENVAELKRSDFPGKTDDQYLDELRTKYPSFKEEYLDKHFGVVFKINPVYKVKIDAKVTQSGYQPFMLSTLLQKRFPIKKKKQLLFMVENNTVPPPFTIMWKVRNFGEEAKTADDLRGEISNDKGYNNKEERTKYYGEHCVECYVIKDRICVGMDRVFVPIDKISE